MQMYNHVDVVVALFVVVIIALFVVELHGHELPAIWGWVIFGWVTKNSAVTFEAMKKYQVYYMGP